MTLVKEVCPVAQRIWQSPDAIMLFFAGGAAEFAAIKAIDWLFFTGALPDDPVGRFFETVRFAQRAFYSDPEQAAQTIQLINRIHQKVEAARGYTIPQWAYRDVLFIILDYGERAHNVVYGPLSMADQLAYFEAVLALGQAMEITDLPTTYAECDTPIPKGNGLLPIQHWQQLAPCLGGYA